MQTPLVRGLSAFVRFEGETPLSALARLPQVMAREHDKATCRESVLCLAYSVFVNAKRVSRIAYRQKDVFVHARHVVSLQLVQQSPCSAVQ